jgi:secreted trypsin-like serine protease
MKQGDFMGCSGTLITDQWLLTAAHCADPNPAVYTLDIGLTKRYAPNPWTISNVKVSKIFKHPAYNPQEVTNDIALMKLAVRQYKILF